MMKKILLLACLMVTCSVMCLAEDGQVEITTSSIKSEMASPHTISLDYRFLYIGLKNSGNAKVNNLNLDISYYADGGFLIKKVTIKHALTESIPPGEERKYKILLDREFNDRDQYPYEQDDAVKNFDVKVKDIKFAWW